MEQHKERKLGIQVERFRSQGKRAPLHVLEKALLWIISIQLCFLPWALGGMPLWSQFANFGISVTAFFVCLLPRIYSPSEGEGGAEFRLIMWPKLVRFPIFWLGGIFLGYVLIQAANSSYYYKTNGVVWWLEAKDAIKWLPSGIDSPTSMMSTWRMLMIYSSAWFSVCAIWVGLTRRRSVQFLFVALAVNGFALSLLGVLERALGATKIYWYWDPPAAYFVSSFIYKNHAGGYFNLILAVSGGLAYWFYSRARRRTERSNPGPIFGFFCIAAVTVVIFSYSRAATILMVCFLALVGVIFAKREVFVEKERRPSFFVVFILLGAVSLFTGLAVTVTKGDGAFWRMSLLLREDPGGSIEGRRIARHAAMEMALDKPILGWGSGGFRYAFPIYQRRFASIFVSNQQRLFWEHVHNDYVELFVETGIVGSSILAAIFAYWIILLIRSYFWSSEMVLVGVIGCLILLVHSFMDFELYNPAVLMTWCAMLPGLAKWAELENSES